jgi:hypothetical protein
MNFTLYKDNKFVMQRKHFYPLRVHLLKALKMKSVFEISTKEVIKEAMKNNYRIEVEK